MKSPADRTSRLYRPCTNAACGKPVHSRARACKECKAPSPWSAAPAEVAKEYVATRDFGCQIGQQLMTFCEGDILTDMVLIKCLVDEECPIEPKKSDDQMLQCSHCGKMTLVRIDAAAQKFSPEVAEKLRLLGHS